MEDEYLKKIVIVLVSFLLVTACSSNEFNELTEQAKNHYYDEEYEEAITVYQKALDIREDVEIRKALSDSKKELELATQYTEFKRKLREYSKELQNIATYNDLEKTCDKIVRDINEFMSIDAEGNLSEAKKIKSIQSEVFLEAALVDASSPHLVNLLKEFTPYDYAQRIKERIDLILEKAK